MHSFLHGNGRSWGSRGLAKAFFRSQSIEGLRGFLLRERVIIRLGVSGCSRVLSVLCCHRDRLLGFAGGREGVSSHRGSDRGRIEIKKPKGISTVVLQSLNDFLKIRSIIRIEIPATSHQFPQHIWCSTRTRKNAMLRYEHNREKKYGQ